MIIETVPIDSIQLDPANVRRHPERNLATIKGSLTRFGQQRPIVVDNRGIVLAGNGTLSAARELGWTEIQIVRTNLTGAEAIGFSIADNRTAETSEWDQTGLSEILAALRKEDQSLVADAGFTLDELASLLGEQAGDQAQPEEFPSFDENIETEHECPRCHFKWSGKAEAA